MPHIPVSKQNPFGLTFQQQLFIAHLMTSIRTAKPIRPKECIKMVYGVKNDATARSMASEYLTKPNIKQAFQHELKKVGLMGKDSKVEHRLTEGLDAVNNTGGKDYGVRLRYIQEIFKVIGIYDDPVETKVQARFYESWDKATLDSKIQELQQELQT